MGSGCSPTGSGGLSALRPTPDTSVIYTGNALPSLGICTGDTLAEVDAVILQQIINFSQGVGISVPDIDLTQCDCFIAKVGCCGKESCQTLTCILQAYLDCLCELYSDVEDLKVKVAAMYDGPYVTKCLSNVNSSSKLPAIMNELISEFCALVTTVAALQTQVNNLSTGLPTTIGNFLNTALTSCAGSSGLKKTGSGSTFKATFMGFTPIGGIIMYGGTLTGKFDSSGLGLATTDMCGWALANGANGTIDMRGYFPVGVNDGSMGSGSQNSEVDNAANPGQNYAQNAHGGAIKVALSAAMCAVAPHSHTVTDPGHSHVIAVNLDSASGSKFSNFMKFDTTSYTNTLDGDPDVGNIHAKIRKNTTGIQIGAVTGSGASTGAAHENRPPYRALYFIQRIS
ncbi:MAG: hypothetical protein E6R03_17660 [Hyphomicrobiaceae bacterium]|nr:MAG: hypothetical protein E6R03_17660 [Hyphomicrobiaceae bacterium]